jgi:nucleotide-binding universal stress UspA family protein
MISARGPGEQILGLAQAIGGVADKILRGASQAVLVVPTRKEEE